jgi:exo-1,4-beta-D-glucosaminidase
MWEQKGMRRTVWGFLVGVAIFSTSSDSAAAKEIPLQDGWALQSACKVTDSGRAISTANYHPAGWLTASVPNTVLAAQVAAGVYNDVYFGMNLRSIPGATYPIGENFSNLPMPADSPYRCGWWYRTQFDAPPAEPGSRFGLQFDGINYSADIWVNGRRIAGQSQVRGAYRTYEFDVSRDIHPSSKNILAVEVFPPTEKDLGMNWVDWNPMPPDKNMGVWSGVRLVTSGPVMVRHTSVITHFEDDTLQAALLTLTADLHNESANAIQGETVADIAGHRISQQVSISPGETVTVTFRPEQFLQLKFLHPRIWWPADYGDQVLQNATVRFIISGRISDQEVIRFGVREITSEFTPQGYRLFRVNGKPILIRGGGWTPDMMLRRSRDRLIAEFDMIRDLHLNAVRLEGKMESEEFFRLADERGVLVLAGWCCCDYWEKWTEWSTDDIGIAAASLQSQMLRLRSHPSLLGWMYGSDNPPPAEVERRYREVIAKTQWPVPVISSASGTPTSSTGASGVKMTGPYEYVAPSYWYQDTSKFGGAFGFNTETGPGPAPEQVPELKRFLPESALWPPDNPAWNFHAGGEDFKNLSVFNRAMSDTYGPVDNVESYARIAQTMTYDGERAMFEAYSGRRYTSTGVIQWLLNNAWPSLIWHLYDYDLVPGGGYYGAKKANEPLHIQYAYDQHAAVVVNSTLSDTYDMEATAEVFSNDLKPLFTKSVSLPVVSANTSLPVIDIPASAWSSCTQFCYIRLSVGKGGGVTVSRNFYWVPRELTVFDWAKTTYINSPVKQSEVMTDLRKLATASVEAEADTEGDAVIVRIANRSKVLAFQLEAEAFDDRGNLIPMVLWNDNYIELMPGESTTLSAAVPRSYQGSTFRVRLSGWNTAPWEQTLAFKPKPGAR